EGPANPKSPRRRTSSWTRAVLPTPDGPTSSTLRGCRPVSISANRARGCSTSNAWDKGCVVRSVPTSGRTDSCFCCSWSSARAAYPDAGTTWFLDDCLFYSRMAAPGHLLIGFVRLDPKRPAVAESRLCLEVVAQEQGVAGAAVVLPVVFRAGTTSGGST